MFTNCTRRQIRIRWCLVALAVGLLAGCMRTRSSNRTAGRRIPLPPPVVEEGTAIVSEAPLNLEPTSPPSSYRGGAGYGPTPGASVAPLGSTGYSTDIRHPQARSSRLTPLPMPSKGTASSGGQSLPHLSETAEMPLALPAKNGSKGTNGRAPTPEKKSPPNESAESATKKSELASGIPNYREDTEPNLATGGQPSLESLKWLKERGIRTVLNLLPENEADPAEAIMVRQLDLEYISLPMTAQTINQPSVERFNEIVDDASHRPLFVHDSNGSRTGAMWYLHLVLVDSVANDTARRRAARVGLKDTDTDLWLAIQQFLAEKK